MLRFWSLVCILHFGAHLGHGDQTHFWDSIATHVVGQPSTAVEKFTGSSPSHRDRTDSGVVSSAFPKVWPEDSSISITWRNLYECRLSGSTSRPGNQNSRRQGEGRRRWNLIGHKLCRQFSGKLTFDNHCLISFLILHWYRTPLLRLTQSYVDNSNFHM